MGRYKIRVKGCWTLRAKWGNDTRFRGAHWESRMNLGGGAKGSHFLRVKKCVQIIAL